jgi:hypothetical protein
LPCSFFMLSIQEQAFFFTLSLHDNQLTFSPVRSSVSLHSDQEAGEPRYVTTVAQALSGLPAAGCPSWRRSLCGITPAVGRRARSPERGGLKSARGTATRGTSVAAPRVGRHTTNNPNGVAWPNNISFDNCSQIQDHPYRAGDIARYTRGCARLVPRLAPPRAGLRPARSGFRARRRAQTNVSGVQGCDCRLRQKRRR